MADNPNTTTTPFLSLPPGCRFSPSEEQLLIYYLARKDGVVITNPSDHCNVIRQLDLRSFAPYALPDYACFSYGYRGRKRHWYCYVNKVRVLKKPNLWPAVGGFWRRSGAVKDVTRRGGKVVLGTRTKFMFYSGNSVKDATKTDWILHEYTSIDQDNEKASFALCRIFAKSYGGNSTSDNALSSCAEETFSRVRDVGVQYEETDSRVRDIGIQCDAFSTPGPLDDMVDKYSVDGKNDISRVQLSWGIPLVDPNRLTTNNIFLESVPREQLQSILDEDFIELDDLLD